MPTAPNLRFLLLFIFIFIFLCVSSSSAAHQTETATFRFRAPRLPVFSTAGHDLLLPFGIRRHLGESNSTGNSTTLVLAAERTRRKDPLDHLNRYTGGFNISNEHYWASVSATAVPFFLLAGIWFVVFGLSLAFICLCYCCCRGDPYGYSRACYALSLIFLIFFTVAAIAGCVVLYTGQGKFNGITSDTLDYVVSQADVTAESLKNVSSYLAAAKSVDVDSLFLPADMRNKLDNLVAKANSSGNTLSSRTQDNRKKIKDGLNGMRLALIILAAVMLALAFLGFLFSIFGMTCFVYFLVILGWILVAGTFILCGVFLLLHKNFPPQVRPPVNYNQSGPLVPLLCNPFNPDLSDKTCAPGEVDLRNATEAWKAYVCQVSGSGGICTTTGRLTPTLYSQMSSAVNVSFGLYRYGPFLVELEDCTFVRRTFTDINREYCPDLRKYTQWIYIGLVIVSAAVMLSLIFWVIYARERRHRVYTKQFMTGSDNKAAPHRI
ncbi:hypothetical protein LINPERPRIM_LOCUS20586 [Linum perenne]